MSCWSVRPAQAVQRLARRAHSRRAQRKHVVRRAIRRHLWIRQSRERRQRVRPATVRRQNQAHRVRRYETGGGPRQLQIAAHRQRAIRRLVIRTLQDEHPHRKTLVERFDALKFCIFQRN